MYKANQPQSSQQIELPQIGNNTSQQLINLQPQQKVRPSFHSKCKIFIALSCMAILIIVLLSNIRNHAHTPQLSEGASSFQLFVYCPYSYSAHNNKRKHLNQAVRTIKLQEHKYKIELAKHNKREDQNDDQDQHQSKYDWNNTYIVQIQSNANGSLHYCGLATSFSSTCEQYVEYKCSSPGPIFDLKINQHVDIVWINNLNPQHYVESQCMNKNDPRCMLDSKGASKYKTYTDPTSQRHASSRAIPITPNNWPVSTHVHGAEVRPTFDGNPLSWIDNAGNRGLGAFSLSDKCYYNSFDNTDAKSNNYLPPELIIKDIRNNYNISTAKINRYPNIQNPGNLWYHDHTMRLTYYNVKNGLSGNYILRDSKVEKEIGVDRSNQRLVMMTTDGWKTQTLTLMTDTVYRFRFLNNHNQWQHIYKISLVYGSNCLSNKFIPFTIIGADSSLFHQGIYNQTSFVIAQAQRIQLLILFKKGISTVYSICSDNNLQLSRKNISSSKSSRNLENNKLISNRKNTNLNTRTSISNVTLPVPFVDFTTKSKLVAVKRMRPLIDINGIMSINGRATFHMGRSQNPIIGTYQDWYLINAMSFMHPIHIHLVNFQVIKAMSLRMINGCTLYELDFILQAIFKGSSYRTNTSIFIDSSDERKVNYTALCNFKSQIYNSPGFHSLLERVNVQNVKDVKNISGINVQKLLDGYDRDLLSTLNIQIPKMQAYKYITNQVNHIKPYYKRWKDTALMQPYKVLVYRIRWAKSQYKDGSNDQFFNVPLDQLREYPGFIYHCHILTDQDNEMMRPIMLQLPEKAKLNPLTPCNSDLDLSWNAKVKCINQIRCKKERK